jgi:hypothetical protein
MHEDGGDKDLVPCIIYEVQNEGATVKHGMVKIMSFD